MSEIAGPVSWQCGLTGAVRTGSIRTADSADLALHGPSLLSQAFSERIRVLANSDKPRSRANVLLFGASNLTLGWNPLMQQLLSSVPGPLDVQVCLGMGRSFLKDSRYLGRVLPGILHCGLWQQLPQPSSSDRVLITDIGNDIVYRFSPPEILAAVQQTVQRVLHWNPHARITMTLPPLVSLQRLHPLHFRIARTLLFPLSTLTFSDVMQAATQLQDLLREFAEQNSLRLIEPVREWYGADPIHIRRSMRAVAFRTLFGDWDNGISVTPEVPFSGPPLPTAERQTLFGQPRLTPQPVFQSDRLNISAW